MTPGHPGANVVVSARPADDLISVDTEIEGLSVSCLVVPADLTGSDSVHELFAEAVGHFGRINVVVNNAGAGGFGPVENATRKDWGRVINTNLISFQERR